MLASHIVIFKKVAQAKQVLIIVRSPNPGADVFIGKPGFTPKPLACKAKTADNPQHEFYGLVLSPLEPDYHSAFLRLDRAQQQWAEFTRYGLPRDFVVEQQGPWKGCLRYGGKLVHADYDLLAVAPQSKPHDDPSLTAVLRPDAPELGVISPLVDEIRKILNTEFKAEMVQHGAEFDVDYFNYGFCECFYANGNHRTVVYTGNYQSGAVPAPSDFH